MSDEYIRKADAIDAATQDSTENRTHSFRAGQARSASRIKALPAADVAPVVHSTWIENGDPLMLTCGNCGYGVMRYNNTRFCPNCCAKMDGGESDG